VEGSSRTPTVFVSDASAEAVRISDMLRTAGYAVVDVPLSMLISRASVQKPNVVLIDVDAPGALDEVKKLRQ
jgi:AmiR/NasT family two-component response regulator